MAYTIKYFGNAPEWGAGENKASGNSRAVIFTGCAINPERADYEQPDENGHITGYLIYDERYTMTIDGVLLHGKKDLPLVGAELNSNVEAVAWQAYGEGLDQGITPYIAAPFVAYIGANGEGSPAAGSTLICQDVSTTASNDAALTFSINAKAYRF